MEPAEGQEVGLLRERPERDLREAEGHLEGGGREGDVQAGPVVPAEGPREFWKNIEQGIDAAEDVPADRWFVDPDDAYSPEVPSADRVYARRACLLGDVELDTEGLGLDAQMLERLDPMFRVALRAAQEAVADARAETLDRERPARRSWGRGTKQKATEKNIRNCWKIFIKY